MSKFRAVGLERWSADHLVTLSVSSPSRGSAAIHPARQRDRQVERYEPIAAPSFGAQLHVWSSLIKENQQVAFEAEFSLAPAPS